jgi:hypothetical protein
MLCVLLSRERKGKYTDQYIDAILPDLFVGLY